MEPDPLVTPVRARSRSPPISRYSLPSYVLNNCFLNPAESLLWPKPWHNHRLRDGTVQTPPCFQSPQPLR